MATRVYSRTIRRRYRDATDTPARPYARRLPAQQDEHAGMGAPHKGATFKCLTTGGIYVLQSPRVQARQNCVLWCSDDDRPDYLSISQDQLYQQFRRVSVDDEMAGKVAIQNAISPPLHNYDEDGVGTGHMSAEELEVYKSCKFR